MNAKCEFINCERDAVLALGDSYFCKEHQESLSSKLSKTVEKKVESSHHVDLSTLRSLMRDPEIKKLLKVSLDKKETEEN
jgi:hypothetical protein